MYTVAIVMGLMGGLHCVGMCGPLVMEVALQTSFKYTGFIYATGRIFTYGILGVLAGGLGQLVQLTKYQSILSFLLGVVLLLLGLGIIKKKIISTILSKHVWGLIARLKTLFRDQLKKKGHWNLLVLGMLNGLLPCGLTYLAMAYCLTLNSLWESFLFMIVFGIGTLPVMISFLWIFRRLWYWVKPNYATVNTVLLVLSGILIVGRSFFLHTHEEDHSKSVFPGWEILCQ